jgi:hypothetical protein
MTRSPRDIVAPSSFSSRLILAILVIAVATTASAFHGQAHKRSSLASSRFKLVEFVDKEFGWSA